MKYYTGVGSRACPGDVLELMEEVAGWLAGRGWTLRSGHAQGADRAFERGAAGKAVVYLPWYGFGVRPYQDDPGMRVMGEAVVLHSTALQRRYDRLVKLGIRSGQYVSQAVKWLHGRNVCQVLGHAVLEADEEPSGFVVCWCPEANGEPQGGTATAVKLARHHGIEVLNLWRAEDRKRVESRMTAVA
jgi:hypothetical protein